jgi:hypothetical protein
MKRLLGVLAIVSAFAVGPAQAQVSADALGLSTVTTTCQSESASDAACDAAVQAYIDAVQASGLSPQQQDDLLADLVVALGSDASAMSAGLRDRIADAIREIAAAVSDPARAARIVAAAADVEAGIDVTAPRVSASAA